MLAYWRIGSYHADPAGADGYVPGAAGGGNASMGTANTAPVIATSSGDGYHPGGTCVLTNTIHYSGTLLSLLWRPELPGGWSLLSVAGDGNPEHQGGEIVWTRMIPPGPIEMTLTVGVPLWEWAERDVRSEVEYWFPDGSPDPSTMRPPTLTVSAADSDGDGLPDGWEAYHTGNPTGMVATADDDLDGVNNFDEGTAGTDPTNRHSVLVTDLPAIPNASGVTLRWSSVTTRVYSISQSTNLLSGFLPFITGIQATPPVNEEHVPGEDSGGHYYRLGVTAP
ncbi:MAG: hypothetical protein GWO24_20390 [Akkermansiaceae bacterium]|nr:hypothetical protein [Akkermansiaceae bacterium]